MFVRATRSRCRATGSGSRRQADATPSWWRPAGAWRPGGCRLRRYGRGHACSRVGRCLERSSPAWASMKRLVASAEVAEAHRADQHVDQAGDAAGQTGVVGVVDWALRDRRTGRIVVAQWPNTLLIVWMAASVVLALFDLDGRWRLALRVVATVALGWWALDEVAR